MMPPLPDGVHALHDEQHAARLAALGRANSRSCRSDSRSAPTASAAAPSSFVPVNPGSSAGRRRRGDARAGRSCSASRVGPRAAPPRRPALERLDPLGGFAALCAIFAAFVGPLLFAIRGSWHGPGSPSCGLRWRARPGLKVAGGCTDSPSGPRTPPGRPRPAARRRGSDRGPERRLPMTPPGTAGGASTCPRPGTAPTTRFSLDGGRPLPDPRSAWQPAGVHGPSRVFDPARYAWGDAGWRGPRTCSARSSTSCTSAPSPRGHPGRGRRAARPPRRPRRRRGRAHAGRRLRRRAGAGATTGSTCTPCTSRTAARTALQRFVDACHAPRARPSCLDVVYNHLGPSGNYLRRFGPYFTEQARHALGRRRQPRRRRLRAGPALDHRQRPALVAGLPRRRAAARRRPRAASTTPPGTCSRSCPTRSPRSRTRLGRPLSLDRRERPQRPADGRADVRRRPRA